jgi:hypothetical protein
MPEDAEFTTSNNKSTKSSTDNLEKVYLLPRSAWNSQLTHLKLLLKAKQALDKNIK